MYVTLHETEKDLFLSRFYARTKRYRAEWFATTSVGGLP